ncbi:MAG: hypothetical protein ACYDBQ_05155 [Thermoplasmatota archaeon]
MNRLWFVPVAALPAFLAPTWPERLAGVALAASAGVAARRWGSENAWLAALFVALSPAATMAGWLLALAAAAALIVASVPYGAWGVLALGFFAPLIPLGAAFMEARYVGLLLVPVAAAWWTVGPRMAVAALGAAAAVATGRLLIPRVRLTDGRVKGVMKGGVTTCALALFAAAAVLPAHGHLSTLSGGLGVAALVALVAFQALAVLVACRTTEWELGWWAIAAVAMLALAGFAWAFHRGGSLWGGPALAVAAIPLPPLAARVSNRFSPRWRPLAAGVGVAAMAWALRIGAP